MDLTLDDYREFVRTLLLGSTDAKQKQTVTIFWRDNSDVVCYATEVDVCLEDCRQYGSNEWVVLAARAQYENDRIFDGPGEMEKALAELLLIGYDLMYIIKGTPEYIL